MRDVTTDSSSNSSETKYFDMTRETRKPRESRSKKSKMTPRPSGGWYHCSAPPNLDKGGPDIVSELADSKKCLYTVKEPTNTRRKTQQTLGMILEKTRARSSPQFETHDVCWKLPGRRSASHTTSDANSIRVGAHRQNITHNQ